MTDHRPRAGLRHVLARVAFATAGAVAALPTPPATAAPPLRRDLSPADDDDPNDDDGLDESEHESDDAPVDDAITAIAESSEPVHAADRIAMVLRHMNPFDATASASLMAMSGSVRARQALAEALATPFHLVGDDMILDVLVLDQDAAVRDAARRASRIREGLVRASDIAMRPAGPQRPIVLVIDNYPGERNALCSCVNELGCEAIGAPSSVAAHDLPWPALVDLVLLRHDPPWMNGGTLLEALRQRNRRVPAILMSNRRHAELDAITMIIPVEIDGLAAAIARLTGRAARLS